MKPKNAAMLAILKEIYGEGNASFLLAHIDSLVENYRSKISSAGPSGFTEKDTVLITYGDQVRSEGNLPLVVLRRFCQDNLQGIVNTIHILPFFPYSSDDGFSVIDYRAVMQGWGSWQDISDFQPGFRLMFDFVCNHISSKSAWFQSFLGDEAPFNQYFITVEGDPDLSAVVRPRALPLCTKFSTTAGIRSVWTTFSEDQVDLNFKDPSLLLEMIDILLFYVSKGASLIRLDAVAYLWKEIGTPCIHLPQTHRVIQLMRAILDQAAPHVALVTETNVPHRENLSYFGNGENEAQMVYNFALPPLMLHTFHAQNTRRLTQWASSLRLPSSNVTFFNFLASHDGIGLNPAREILSPSEMDHLVHTAQKHGGHISYKSNPDGTSSPYEININYFDALSDPGSNETIDTQVDRFICAHAIMLSLQGVPGIYFHSLFGSRNWQSGVETLKYKRAINREKLALTSLKADLASPRTVRNRVFSRLSCLLKLRSALSAFSPSASQKVFDAQPSLFVNLRSTPDLTQKILCVFNVTPMDMSFEIDDIVPGFYPRQVKDLKPLNREGQAVFLLRPYEFVWITNSGKILQEDD
jgi:glucosylglycerate phosphorylase